MSKQILPRMWRPVGAAAVLSLAWLPVPAFDAAPAQAATPVAASPAAVAPKPPAIKAGTVRISGSQVAFKRLRVKLRGWSPAKVRFRYQWYAGSKAIKGATKSSYVLPANMVGRKIWVKVKATAPKTKTVYRRSPATRAVKWPAVNRRCKVRGRVLCADKNLRKLFQVKNGKILAAYDARFGRKGMRTHNGTHRIYWKHRNHVSSQFGSKMPFSQFFYRGEAVHYNAEFGKRGYGVGSHGCINLASYSAARKLFNWTRTGDKVVVYGRDR